jgi:hypothetical protein
MQEARRIVPGSESVAISPQVFAAGAVIFCSAAALAIGGFPLQASIITIFLFAGVHNFMEFRYFLARMPVRWGRSMMFYSVGIGGTAVLTIAYLAIYFLGGNWLWDLVSWQVAVSFWNTAFILWVGFLFYLRGRQKPRSDWGIAIAAAMFLAGAQWFAPAYWSLSLVYLHPLIALWFLDRQLKRTRPEWLSAYRYSVATVPVFLLGLWIALAGTHDLPSDTNLFWRIAQHAGAGLVGGVSTHFLVASHVFLETVHYAVWILLIPLADPRAVPWRIRSIPFFERSGGFPKLTVLGLAISGLLVLVLWDGFSFDYATTRDIYFAFAIAHVLAEFPFLVKML